MDKKNVLWFSRHQPTQEQLDECAKQGWNVVGRISAAALRWSK